MGRQGHGDGGAVVAARHMRPQAFEQQPTSLRLSYCPMIWRRRPPLLRACARGAASPVCNSQLSTQVGDFLTTKRPENRGADGV